MPHRVLALLNPELLFGFGASVISGVGYAAVGPSEDAWARWGLLGLLLAGVGTATWKLICMFLNQAEKRAEEALVREERLSAHLNATQIELAQTGAKIAKLYEQAHDDHRRAVTVMEETTALLRRIVDNPALNGEEAFRGKR